MNVNESLSYPARDAKDNLIRDASGNPTMVPAHKVDDYAREYRHDGEIHTFGGLSAQRWVPTDPASKARTLIIFRGTAPALRRPRAAASWPISNMRGSVTASFPKKRKSCSSGSTRPRAM